MVTVMLMLMMLMTTHYDYDNADDDCDDRGEIMMDDGGDDFNTLPWSVTR